MSVWSKHKIFETNSIILVVGILVVVAIGGLVEIAPLYYLKSTIEKVDGMRPYTPLELAGRNIYVREGCYNCHSQMIRPLRDEVERYGHYSLAAESMYDRPFQWGSKRTGPDLARVGGKYSDEWHVAHFKTPRQIVPATVMPGYGFLFERDLDYSRIADDMKIQKALGVPYTDDMIKNAIIDVRAQAIADSPDVDKLKERYKAGAKGAEKMPEARDFDMNPARISEADALIAYLQMLGTLVDFKRYDSKANIR
jgi:cytochrome c oxidase cbb3-type subunit 2